ncbi:MAG: PQQ-binding-like beta-propeller repeat protein [Planctomycetota bacterium]
MIRTLTLCLLCLTICSGSDWTRFRGPGGTGVSEDTGLPRVWDTKENVAWKATLPGFGSSSPITLGERIFLTCYAGYGFDADEPGDQSRLTQHTLCLDRATGRIRWSRSIEPRLPETDYADGRIDLHGYASATPVTDSQAVYVFFGKSGVFKYSLDGELMWQTSVGSDIDSHNWGSGASPILHNDLLIVNASAESQSIRALDTDTGKERWRVDEIVDSWSTPLVVSAADGSEELVVVERSKVLGLDPATGQTLWYYEKPSDYVCPSVIAHQDVVYLINSRFKALLMAIRVGGQGDIAESHVLWSKRWTTRVSTPVYHEGYLYGIDFRGRAYCINAQSGETVYQERLNISGSGDKIYASLVAGDGKIYGVSRLDGTVVLALEPRFQLLAHNHLGDDSVFNATPTVSNGQLLLRSDRALYCIGRQTQ